MASMKIEFPGGQGDTLAARLDLPAAPPRAFALFAHCFTCSKDSRAANHIARGMVEQGIALLRFDFTGLGGSDGEFANTHFSSNLDDLVAAADWLRREHAAPSLLVGHSFGGAAVLAVAQRISEVRAVVTLNAPFATAHVLKQLGDDVAHIERDGQATIDIAGRQFTIRREFEADVSAQRQGERIGALRRPLLVMHAPTDRIVGIDEATGIYSAAKHPKSFIALDGADHLLSRADDARYAAQVIAAWAGRYLPERPAHPAPAAGVLRVTETGIGKFAARVQTNSHVLHADEPLAAGGNDTGLSPYELLSAALGTCTVMTLRMYADLKQLPLARASIEIEHGKIHADDCADCDTKERKIDHLQCRLTLEGDLSAEQRQRLQRIADRCPVHRTLKSEVRISTQLGD